jgi:glutamate-1-semialdehyde 2,1-aminomutase
MPALSRRLAGWIRIREYDEQTFLRADGASDEWVERRQRGLRSLVERCGATRPLTAAWGRAVRDSFSDLRFTDASRVPYPFAGVMRSQFDLCTAVTASAGPRLKDLDGNWHFDLGGSYGLNVAGYDRYKVWMQAGMDQVKELGAVLGPLHPVVADNIERLKRISGLDEVSFHMSGTEAVMAAARLARFNTRRRLVVCFAGAYHGWWDGVQPGLGSERTIDDCLTLKDMSQSSLKVIRRRAAEIAAVLVNPVQSFHPNSPPPNDAVLLTSGARKASSSTLSYGEWLRSLAEVCRACDIPLILDEVYTGFRLSPGGAQDYFGVHADMVVYGKTLGGGLPVGVVCGTSALMRRFDPDRPMRMAYVVGTFSAHPVVMGAMNEFLKWVEEPGTSDEYERMNQRCEDWVRSTNVRLAEASLPVRLMNLATIWTVVFLRPSRYNWLLQYYLRAEGLSLSWVGTGRCLSAMDVSREDYVELQEKVVRAAAAMKTSGWWVTDEDDPGVEKRMRKQLMRDVVASMVPVPEPIRTFVATVMARKRDDHHASHNDRANQLLHLVSSSVFIYCYAIIVADLTTAMCLGLASLFVRQFGHAVLEPACHEEESKLLGFTTRSKTLIVLGYCLIPLIQIGRAQAWSLDAALMLLDAIALDWFRWTVGVVLGRVLFLAWKFDWRNAMVWFVKLVTDPFTDVVTYAPWRLRRA